MTGRFTQNDTGLPTSIFDTWTTGDTASGPSYTLTNIRFYVYGYLGIGQDDFDSAIGIFSLSAGSGGSSRTFNSVSAVVSGGSALTVTELVKLDGIANFCGLWMVDLSGATISGGAGTYYVSVDVSVTLSGTIANGLALSALGLRFPRQPIIYNTGSASHASTDPLEATVSHYGSGALFWFTTNNSTTGGAVYTLTLNGSSCLLPGVISAHQTHGSRRHGLNGCTSINAVNGEYVGFVDSTQGLLPEGNVSLGSDYSGTASNIRTLAVAIRG